MNLTSELVSTKTQNEEPSPSKTRSLTLDNFTLLSVIGEGSYSKVALVRKKSNRKIYALKVLKKNSIKTSQQFSKVQAERDILRVVEHPFIVKLSYTFQSEKKLFFVLEYCPGGELFNLLQKQKAFSEDEARFYAAQILLALEALHKKEIIYRDLKPENVLIDKDGYLRITDFGLSKMDIKSGKNAYTVCGTPEYFAPEILTQHGHSKEVDWWTFGTMLYEMLKGTPPFYSDTRKELFKKIASSKVNFPEKLSSVVTDLLEKLLTKDPKERLGYGPDDAEAIKKHPWFEGFDWNALLDKKLKAPFVPRITNETDISNFDPEFTSVKTDSITDHNAQEDATPDFLNWSFEQEKEDGDLQNNTCEGGDTNQETDK